MKNRPILVVIIILGITALSLGLAMTAIVHFRGSSSGFGFSHRIGVITVEGIIRDAGPIVSQLVEFRKDKGIKAIIFRVDSPGGGVGASQEIYREVRKTTMEKKVIMSLGGVAASGAYYIASAGDKIVANPGTITGSIGVIMEFIRIQDLFKKIGINLEVLKSGEYKDIGSPHRELTEREKALLQGLITEIQNQFVNDVAAGRGIPGEKVREIADGRIFSGERAKELALVDQLGNFRDAVDLAKQLAGIEGEVRLVFPEKDEGILWNIIFKNISKIFDEMITSRLTQMIEYRWGGFIDPVTREKN